jgi:hypothetical protein
MKLAVGSVLLFLGSAQHYADNLNSLGDKQRRILA